MLLAWLVHLYTALGAVVAVFTVVFVAEGHYRPALALMVLALILDATDGTFARAARVKERVPRIDGARLDDIVDYLNYVFVPCFLLLRADLLPAGTSGGWSACRCWRAPTVSRKPTPRPPTTTSWDSLPTGTWWPSTASCWRGARGSTAPWWPVLSVMVFVPIRYLYPSRNTLLQGLTVTLGAVWGLLCITVVYLLPDPPRGLVVASLFYPVYYVALSFWSHLRNRA